MLTILQIQAYCTEFLRTLSILVHRLQKLKIIVINLTVSLNSLFTLSLGKINSIIQKEIRVAMKGNRKS